MINILFEKNGKTAPSPAFSEELDPPSLCLSSMASSPFTFKENSKTYKVKIKYILRQVHSGSDALNR